MSSQLPLRAPRDPAHDEGEGLRGRGPATTRRRDRQRLVGRGPPWRRRPYVDYAAAKGAIESFTVGLAKEVAAEGIRVNAVRPGIIETDIHASGGQPDRVRQMSPLVPMQRAGTAEEVAEAIVWLLCDASSYTTASIIDVSGGR